MTSAPLRIMVIEDDDLLRELVRLNLERRGRFTVVGEAEDGATGIRLAGELAPDVILLDLLMPAMSGFEALPILRKAAPTSRIIVLSMLWGVGQKVIDKGADAFVDKGLEGDELEARIWQECNAGPLTIMDLKAAATPAAPTSKTLNAHAR